LSVAARTVLPGGVWPVMLTPFEEDSSIDWAALDALTDWYIAAGASGLFTVCLSGEMYALQPDERLAVAAAVVRYAAGRVPVAAAGTFGGSVEEQAASVCRMYDTGISAVIVIVNQLAAADEDDGTWLSRAERLLHLTPEVPLGLYECPRPYHRLLSPSMLAWAARSGRFYLLKDTTCRLGPIRAKIQAVQGTPLRFLNAHTPTLLKSLRAGGHGYCGTAANWYPQLLVWLCEHAETDPARAESLQHLLGVADKAVAFRYPRSAKVYLRSLGIPIGPSCREPCEGLEERDLTVLDHLRDLVTEQSTDLGIAAPATAVRLSPE